MNHSFGALERQILHRREALLGFIRSRVDDDELAEDILQESLLRALEAAPALRDEEKLVSWFYRIIRNAITDTYRRRAAAARRLERYALEQPHPEEPTPEEHAALCECFRAVLPTMKPEYAELVASMDLAEESAERVAERLDVTRNNLKVRHHRARRQLRERLLETCRTCATHGCLDCTCESGARPPHVHP